MRTKRHRHTLSPYNVDDIAEVCGRTKRCLQLRAKALGIDIKRLSLKELVDFICLFYNPNKGV